MLARAPYAALVLYAVSDLRDVLEGLDVLTVLVTGDGMRLRP